MSRCLVTFGVGSEHEELLRIALPTFHEFAGRHGYDLLVAQPEPCDRPPSWWKIPVLQDALDAYEEALWIDADVAITDPREDVAVPAYAWQALVEHKTADGLVPNLGVWYLRQPMHSVLDWMWGRTEYVDHGWWEQAAMLDLLGYKHEPRPVTLTTATELYRATRFLDAGWNVHRNDQRRPQERRFMHATMYPDRAATMREWVEEAFACAS